MEPLLAQNLYGMHDSVLLSGAENIQNQYKEHISLCNQDFCVMCYQEFVLSGAINLENQYKQHILK